MTIYLVDTSVQQRLDRSLEVRRAVEGLLGHGDLVASCVATVLEAGYSARTVDDHAQVLHLLGEVFVRLPLTPEVGATALDLQTSLFARNRGRAAGVVDLLLAATAIVHHAVVVHYDADFEVLAEADERLRQQWVVPRGSVD